MRMKSRANTLTQSACGTVRPGSCGDIMSWDSMREIDGLLRRQPDLGTLPAQAEELRAWKHVAECFESEGS
jgi:hypothetical protein